MTKLKAGDKVVCCLKRGYIVSSYAGYDEEKDFEIIALDYKGYFLYVPDYYNMSPTTLITPSNLAALKINKKFLGTNMVYVEDLHIFKVRMVLDGMSCCSCNEFYKFSEPNQPDGTLKCWSCRAYPSWL